MSGSQGCGGMGADWKASPSPHWQDRDRRINALQRRLGLHRHLQQPLYTYSDSCYTYPGTYYSVPPFALSLALYVPTPFPMPLITILVPLSTTQMPNPATTGSHILNQLIAEVELVEHIDILVEGDAIDAEAKIDDPLAA
ncbi:hypothetical protein Ancab_004303 [Ancistrocladus abbreviatus]